MPMQFVQNPDAVSGLQRQQAFTSTLQGAGNLALGARGLGLQQQQLQQRQGEFQAQQKLNQEAKMTQDAVQVAAMLHPKDFQPRMPLADAISLMEGVETQRPDLAAKVRESLGIKGPWREGLAGRYDWMAKQLRASKTSTVQYEKDIAKAKAEGKRVGEEGGPITKALRGIYERTGIPAQQRTGEAFRMARARAAGTAAGRPEKPAAQELTKYQKAQVLKAQLVELEQIANDVLTDESAKAGLHSRIGAMRRDLDKMTGLKAAGSPEDKAEEANRLFQKELKGTITKAEQKRLDELLK